MSGIRSVFESIDLEAIRRYIARQEQEHLHLEFKTLEDPGFSRNDRRNLARALSGFGNSDGGLILWGIDARRTRRVDAAIALRPIADLARASSEIQTLTGEAASPAVPGVDHKPIMDTGAAGFIVTLVPASDGGPHMAKCGEDRYYRRSGSTFRRMEHFEIEDMFGRRPRPCLSFYASISIYSTISGPQGQRFDVSIVVGIRNTGRGVARFPSLRLQVTPPWKISPYGLDGNRNTGLPRLAVRRAAEGGLFAGGADQVVHVDTMLDVTRIDRGPVEIALESPPPPVRIHYRIAADGVSPIESQHVIPGDEIIQSIRSAMEPSDPG